nr:MAG TPA: hypothetical protein [Caudoviricetes sp.]
MYRMINNTLLILQRLYEADKGKIFDITLYYIVVRILYNTFIS